mgnify:CR=1 FL=1
MDKKLYRDPQNGMIAGVCAGVAEYFGWDPTWVRLGWALFTPVSYTHLRAHET